MIKEEIIIEASPIGRGVTRWLMGLSTDDHGVLRDKLWRSLTEEDFTPTVAGDSNGFFIVLSGRGYRVIFRASVVAKIPIVTISRVTEVVR